MLLIRRLSMLMRGLIIWISNYDDDYNILSGPNSKDDGIIIEELEENIKEAYLMMFME